MKWLLRILLMLIGGTGLVAQTSYTKLFENYSVPISNFTVVTHSAIKAGLEKMVQEEDLELEFPFTVDSLKLEPNFCNHYRLESYLNGMEETQFVLIDLEQGIVYFARMHSSLSACADFTFERSSRLLIKDEAVDGEKRNFCKEAGTDYTRKFYVFNETTHDFEEVDSNGAPVK